LEIGLHLHNLGKTVTSQYVTTPRRRV